MFSHLYVIKLSRMEEYLFITKQTIEAEERGEVISRTILDEWGSPIGTISLFDLQENAGFLGTWIGKPYHGKGYNQRAKNAFFNELFYELNIETVFLRIRKQNVRSTKAAEKLPYVVNANETRAGLLRQINNGEDLFNLFEITKIFILSTHITILLRLMITSLRKLNFVRAGRIFLIHLLFI